MSEATAQHVAPPAPLVSLTEDEQLFRDTVRQFADESVRPHVKKMDEEGVFDDERWLLCGGSQPRCGDGSGKTLASHPLPPLLKVFGLILPGIICLQGV